jgi:tetrapyrrole methylase family protein/MazG family protein
MTLGDEDRIEAELGDVLFAIVNLGRFLSIDTEEALRKATVRFTTRFSHIEDTLQTQGVELKKAPMETMEQLWCEAKALEREGKQMK